MVQQPNLAKPHARAWGVLLLTPAEHSVREVGEYLPIRTKRMANLAPAPSGWGFSLGDGKKFLNRVDASSV